MTLNSSGSFEWDEYLNITQSIGADAQYFRQYEEPPENNFEINVLIEAVDQRSAVHDSVPPHLSDNLGKRYASKSQSSQIRRFRPVQYALATVIEKWGPRIRVRLEGTDNRNDCWFMIDSDQIRPYPSGEPLQPPFGYMHSHSSWSRTLKKAIESHKPADPSWFVPPPPDPGANRFKQGQKLEAVDRRNAQLICPATIGRVSGPFIEVNFDGYSGAFDYWARYDSRDLFPCGWCKRAGYPLQSPGHVALKQQPSPSSGHLPAVVHSTTPHPRRKRTRSTSSEADDATHEPHPRLLAESTPIQKCPPELKHPRPNKLDDVSSTSGSNAPLLVTLRQKHRKSSKSHKRRDRMATRPLEVPGMRELFIETDANQVSTTTMSQSQASTDSVDSAVTCSLRSHKVATASSGVSSEEESCRPLPLLAKVKKGLPRPADLEPEDDADWVLRQLPYRMVPLCSVPCVAAPADWTVEQVCEYLLAKDSSLAEAADVFREQEIDGQALLLLKMSSLRWMQLKFGPALKLDHLVTSLRDGFY